MVPQKQFCAQDIDLDLDHHLIPQNSVFHVLVAQHPAITYPDNFLFCSPEKDSDKKS